MCRSQIAIVLLFSTSLSDVSAAGPPKTVDCLQVSVVPQSADPERAAKPVLTPPGTRPVHMILTNVCSVDVTAFTLDINVSSPIPQGDNFGIDMLGRLAGFNNLSIPQAGAEFPFDWGVAGEPEDDPRPRELSVKVRGLIFRDGTAVGDAAWVTDVQAARMKTVQQFATELKMMAQIARLEDAKAILKGDPDSSLKDGFRAFWLENKGNLSNDPAEWARYIDRRAYWLPL